MSTYPRAGLQRILAGSINPDLRVLLRNQDGEAVDAVGTLTCSIARADGTVVATDRATTDATSTGVYTCALTTAEALTLDVLTATWRISGVTRAVSYHRTVGGFIFSIAELAQRAGMQTYDHAQLFAERERITDLFESYCGAQTPRYDRDQFYGRGSTSWVVAGRPVRAIRSVMADDVSQTLTNIDLDPNSGTVHGVVPFIRECSIGYEHGLDQPPDDLRAAALAAAADSLQRSKGVLGPRVRSATNDLGITQQFGYAGKDHPTGLDEVDAIIMRHAQTRIAIG